MEVPQESGHDVSALPQRVGRHKGTGALLVVLVLRAVGPTVWLAFPRRHRRSLGLRFSLVRMLRVFLAPVVLGLAWRCVKLLAPALREHVLGPEFVLQFLDVPAHSCVLVVLRCFRGLLLAGG
jgi:hypothetical protein